MFDDCVSEQSESRLGVESRFLEATDHLVQRPKKVITVQSTGNSREIFSSSFATLSKRTITAICSLIASHFLWQPITLAVDLVLEAESLELYVTHKLSVFVLVGLSIHRDVFIDKEEIGVIRVVLNVKRKERRARLTVGVGPPQEYHLVCVGNCLPVLPCVCAFSTSEIKRQTRPYTLPPRNVQLLTKLSRYFH